jgi:hypothetical protein
LAAFVIVSVLDAANVGVPKEFATLVPIVPLPLVSVNVFEATEKSRPVVVQDVAD